MADYMIDDDTAAQIEEEVNRKRPTPAQVEDISGDGDSTRNNPRKAKNKVTQFCYALTLLLACVLWGWPGGGATYTGT